MFGGIIFEIGYASCPPVKQAAMDYGARHTERT
jgi:hypothetical protein